MRVSLESHSPLAPHDLALVEQSLSQAWDRRDAALAWRALRRAQLAAGAAPAISPLVSRLITLRALRERRLVKASSAGRGRLRVAAAPAEPWRCVGPRLEPDEAVSLVLTMIELGAREEAVLALKLLMVAHPERAQLPYLLAQLALEAGRARGALRYALLASLRERSRSEPHALAGHLLHRSGQLRLGQALLKRALALAPGDARAWAWLAELEVEASRSFQPSTPLVSVIVPVYNGARTLARTLDSILGQTLEAIEVIVVDDGSTDDSAAVVRACSDPRVSWHAFPNGGPSLCRNRGAALARGALLSWCDADDVWHPEKLAAQCVALELDAAADVVYSGVRFIDQDDRPLMEARLPPAAGDDMRWAMLKGCLPICGSNVLMRRAAFERAGGFDPSLRLAEDWDLWLRLASGHRWARVMAHHVDYRVSPGSASTDVLSMERASLEVLQRAQARMPGAPEAVRAQALVNLYGYLANKSLGSPWSRRTACAAWRYMRLARRLAAPPIEPMVGCVETWRLGRRRLRGLPVASTLPAGRRLVGARGGAAAVALARDPRWTVQQLLTEALYRQARRQPAAARQLLLRGLALDPTHSQIHYLLGDLAIHAGRLEEALAHVVRSLGWSRRQPDPFALAGYLLHLLGDSALGRYLLERALALDPDHARARACLADVLARPRATRVHPDLEVLARPQTLGACLIVKNEAKQLRRHLRAALPHLDECVVVDTGSSDDTVAVATALGARVAHFPWCDDFSAARNAALALGTADWVLVFDADEEVVVPVGHLHDLIERLPLPSLTGVAPIVNVAYINHVGSPLAEDGWQVESVPRLFPRACYRYAGLVHELPALREGAVFREAAYSDHAIELHHHGYRPELLRERGKLERNAQLLRRRVEAVPDDLHGRFLLGRELLLLGEFEEAAEVLAAHQRDWPSDARPAIPRMAAAYLALALSGQGRHADALAGLEEARALDPDFPSYCYVAGEILQAMGRHAEAAEAFRGALGRWNYHAKHPLTTYNSVPPLHVGAAAHARWQQARSLAASGALPAAPSGPEAVVSFEAMIALALGALDRGELALAEAELTCAAGLAPENSQVPFLQAELALRADDLDRALERVRRSLELGPARPEPWALAGYVLHQRGDSRLGGAFLQQALAREPGHRAAIRLLAHVEAGWRDFAAHPELEAWAEARYSITRSMRPAVVPGLKTVGR